MRNRTLNIHHERRSTRCPGWDYRTGGAYFLTICTKDREEIFGEVKNERMLLNEIGQITVREWMRTPEFRTYVRIDEFVIMPNHIHAILWLTDPPGRGVLQYAPTGREDGMPVSPSVGIGAIVRGWKSTTTKQINQLRGMFGIPIWQRNYHDHIIRDDHELETIREYIRNNPSKWNDDEYAKGSERMRNRNGCGNHNATR